MIKALIERGANNWVSAAKCLEVKIKKLMFSKERIRALVDALFEAMFEQHTSANIILVCASIVGDVSYAIRALKLGANDLNGALSEANDTNMYVFLYRMGATHIERLLTCNSSVIAYMLNKGALYSTKKFYGWIQKHKQSKKQSKRSNSYSYSDTKNTFKTLSLKRRDCLYLVWNIGQKLVCDDLCKFTIYFIGFSDYEVATVRKWSR